MSKRNKSSQRIQHIANDNFEKYEEQATFNKKELSFCFLDCGNRNDTVTADNIPVFYWDNPVSIGDLVTLTEDSAIDSWVAKKAGIDDVAIGYAIIKGNVDSQQKYERAGILVLGQIFRIKIDKTDNYGWHVNNKVLLNGHGLSASEGQDLGFLATHNVETGSINDYAIVVRSLYGLPLKQFPNECLDLSEIKYTQEEGVIFMDVPEGNLLENSEIKRDNQGITYWSVPEKAIINSVTFHRENETDKIIKNWLGCNSYEP